VHPWTQAVIVYVAAVPISESGVQIRHRVTDLGDSELTEVRSVSTAEADDLMPDMTGRRREHLQASGSRKVIEPKLGS
jgi:hypothetical protein